MPIFVHGRIGGVVAVSIMRMPMFIFVCAAGVRTSNLGRFPAEHIVFV
ncbi:hypothetical protein [Cryobacterium sp. Y50]|nr:hypothetical protein [Cryobacterium sp. Y50]